MEPSFFLRGLIIGFSIAAPVGPVCALCIRRTIAYGRLVGFVSGIGAACADGIYGAIAAFGLTAISGAIIGQSGSLRAIGGAVLLYLGAPPFVARPGGVAAGARLRGAPRGRGLVFAPP